MIIYWILTAVVLAEKDQGTIKVNALRKLSQQSDGLIPFTTEDYIKYAVDYPRPYTLVTIFTIEPDTRSCKRCEELNRYMSQIRYSYKESGGDYPGTGPRGKSRAVFFAILTYSVNTKDLFVTHSFGSVPNILVSHPKSIALKKDKFVYNKEDSWEINANTELHVHKVLDFINNRANRDIKLKVPRVEGILSSLYMLSFILAVALVVYCFRRLFLVPRVWFCGTLFIYCICVSGAVFNIIRNAPLIGMDYQTREPELVSTNLRSQYAGEGFLMGFSMTIGGLGFVLAFIAPKFQNRFFTRGAGIFGLILVGWSIYTIHAVYRLKAAWYKPSFYPPDHYVRGPFINDQGLSF